MEMFLHNFAGSLVLIEHHTTHTLLVRAFREEMPPAELKSDMESIAYMMGFKKALAKSKLDLQEKCKYLERKCKEALVAMKFQLMMVLRYRRREQGEPENINQLFNEVVRMSLLPAAVRCAEPRCGVSCVDQNLDLGDVDYGDDDGDEYDPDEEDVVEMEDFNRALSAEEEMEAEDEQWEQLHLNADLWEELVAEFEQLDGNEYEADTIDDIRRECEEASAQTRPQKKGGSGRKKRRSGSDATPPSASSSLLATKWGRVMSAARRRRRPSKANTREGTRAQGESSQSPH